MTLCVYVCACTTIMWPAWFIYYYYTSLTRLFCVHTPDPARVYCSFLLLGSALLELWTKNVRSMSFRTSSRTLRGEESVTATTTKFDDEGILT